MNPSTLVRIGMDIDRHATLYKYGNKIIRAINPEFTDFYLKILSSNVVQKLLSDDLLIETSISSLKLDGHHLILEHPKLPFISFPFEWTPSMFKDATLNILNLNLNLLKNGLCTQDAHPWNVLFDGTKPKFVDFTSIIKLPSDGKWIAQQELNKYCWNSLQLMAKGYSTTVRSLNREIFYHPDPNLVEELYGHKKLNYRFTYGFAHKLKRYKYVILNHENVRELYGHHAFLYEKTHHLFEKTRQVLKNILNYNQVSESIKEIEKLIVTVENTDVRPRTSEWSKYYSGENELPVYDGSAERLNSIRNATPKHTLIDNLLEKVKPATVLDIGCNRGLYSQMAAARGAKVIGFDTDELALDQMYHDAKINGSYVLPLYVNAIAPVEATGFKEIPFPSVQQRFQSECVLCLALVHHLVFKRSQMKFAHIARLLSSYTLKYLIVEFVPKEDRHVAQWNTEMYSWYNLHNFKLELGQYFKSIQVFESFPAPRVILFCEKEK